MSNTRLTFSKSGNDKRTQKNSRLDSVEFCVVICVYFFIIIIFRIFVFPSSFFFFCLLISVDDVRFSAMSPTILRIFAYCVRSKKHFRTYLTILTCFVVVEPRFANINIIVRNDCIIFYRAQFRTIKRW